jgi:hypothetical protein
MEIVIFYGLLAAIGIGLLIWAYFFYKPQRIAEKLNHNSSSTIMGGNIDLYYFYNSKTK